VYIVPLGFSLGTLSVSTLFINQFNPSTTLPFFFPPPHIIQQFSVCFMCLVPTQILCSSLLFTIIFFLVFLLP
jgi:hypothetical protein